MSRVIHADGRGFDREVLAADVPVLVDFFAPWCGPCRVLAPALERLAAERGERAKVVKVDVTEEPDLAARYGIEAVPTLIVFSGGQAVRGFQGLVPLDALRAALDDVSLRRSA